MFYNLASCRRETFASLMTELDKLLSNAVDTPFQLTFRTVVHTTTDEAQALLTSPLYRFERYGFHMIRCGCKAILGGVFG